MSSQDAASNDLEMVERINEIFKKCQALHQRSYPTSSLDFVTMDLSRRVKWPRRSVGRGRYSDVYKGALDDSTMVAVKVLRLLAFGPMMNERYEATILRFFREMNIWHALDHLNIAHFLGFTLANGEIGLVSVWYSNGNVVEYLKASPQASIPDLILDVAEGVGYLHSYPQPVIHADLRGVNIFVTEGGVACIGDFGISKRISDMNRTTGFTTASGVIGTSKWMAPELLISSTLTTASDMYSFGGVLLEISCPGKAPYHYISSDPQVIIAKHAGKLPDRSHYPELSNQDVLWNIVMACFSSDPQERPNITTVTRDLYNLFKLSPRASSSTLPRSIAPRPPEEPIDPNNAPAVQHEHQSSAIQAMRRPATNNDHEIGSVQALLEPLSTSTASPSASQDSDPPSLSPRNRRSELKKTALLLNPSQSPVQAKARKNPPNQSSIFPIAREPQFLDGDVDAAMFEANSAVIEHGTSSLPPLLGRLAPSSQNRYQCAAEQDSLKDLSTHPIPSIPLIAPVPLTLPSDFPSSLVEKPKVNSSDSRTASKNNTDRPVIRFQQALDSAGQSLSGPPPGYEPPPTPIRHTFNSQQIYGDPPVKFLGSKDILSQSPAQSVNEGKSYDPSPSVNASTVYLEAYDTPPAGNPSPSPLQTTYYPIPQIHNGPDDRDDDPHSPSPSFGPHLASPRSECDNTGADRRLAEDQHDSPTIHIPSRPSTSRLSHGFARSELIATEPTLIHPGQALPGSSARLGDEHDPYQQLRSEWVTWSKQQVQEVNWHQGHKILDEGLVLYDWDGSIPGRRTRGLPLQAGNRVYICNIVNESWYQVHHQDRCEYVPSLFLIREKLSEEKSERWFKKIHKLPFTRFTPRVRTYSDPKPSIWTRMFRRKSGLEDDLISDKIVTRPPVPPPPFDGEPHEMLQNRNRVVITIKAMPFQVGTTVTFYILLTPAPRRRFTMFKFVAELPQGQAIIGMYPHQASSQPMDAHHKTTAKQGTPFPLGTQYSRFTQRTSPETENPRTDGVAITAEGLNSGRATLNATESTAERAGLPNRIELSILLASSTSFKLKCWSSVGLAKESQLGGRSQITDGFEEHWEFDLTPQPHSH